MMCKFCNEEITDQRGAWREVTGWVSPHGAKAMTLAHQTGALAHAHCVAAQKAGVNVNQESFA